MYSSRKNGTKKKKKKKNKSKKSQHAHDTEVPATDSDDNHHGHKRAHDDDVLTNEKKTKSAATAANKSKKSHPNEISDITVNKNSPDHYGHKRVAHHDDEDEEDTLLLSPAQKRQRWKNKSTTTTSTTNDNLQSSRSKSNDGSSILLYLFFYALGTFITMPLIFSTCARLSCSGGRMNSVYHMVDLILLKKKSNESSSLVDLMGVLKHASVPTNEEEGEGQTKKRKKKGTKLNDNDEMTMESTTLHESMCQVSSIAIGNFVYYLPYAQWLVLRNPFASSSEVDDISMMGYHDEQQQMKDDERRKGMFQRVAARHKKKHQEQQQQHTSSSKSAASEEIDRKHPVRHILEGASIFFHHRKQKKMRRKQHKQQGGQRGAGGDGERVVDWKKWKYAMSDDYELTSEEIRQVKELAERVTAKADSISTECKDSNAENCNNSNQSEKQIASLSEGSNMPYKSFQERLDAVSWGGITNSDSTRWWQRKWGKDPKKISSQSEGARVLAAYLKIMKWPKDMHAKYPFRLCAKGCDSEVSLLHTLEWREKYKPWCVSDAAVQFNKDGFIYIRGHSRLGPKQLLEAEKSNDKSIIANGGHSMVLYRPGLASPAENSEFYGRNMINALEMAVSDSLARNKGTIGRFNVVMDCTGMSSKNSPSIANVKKLFSVLQDHFPDRLGVILAANLSGLTQMLMKMVLPFVTEDVRAKIHIIPNGEEERREMLLQFMEEEEIPHYLGGKDEYKFDAKEYYEGKCILPEEGILEYRSTMPYHA